MKHGVCVCVRERERERERAPECAMLGLGQWKVSKRSLKKGGAPGWLSRLSIRVLVSGHDLVVGELEPCIRLRTVSAWDSPSLSVPPPALSLSLFLSLSQNK